VVGTRTYARLRSYRTSERISILISLYVCVECPAAARVRSSCAVRCSGAGEPGVRVPSPVGVQQIIYYRRAYASPRRVVRAV
jgi:hypothetical protein